MPSSSTLNAVFTTAARVKYAQKLGNLFVPASILSYISSFKVGMGGWNPDGSPRTPSPGLTDLDIVLDQTRPAIEKRYPALTVPPYNITYQKSFIPGQLAAASNVLTAGCEITNAEYNDDGLGGAPVVWEIGLFDTDDTMIVYGTYNGIAKTTDRALSFPIRMTI